MKKRILLLLGWLLLGYLTVPIVLGQIRSVSPFGKNFQFDLISTDTRSNLRGHDIFTVPDNAVYVVFDYLKKHPHDPSDMNMAPNSPIILGVKLNPTLLDYFCFAEVQSVSKNYKSYTISDSSAATLIALGITAQNVNDYKYHVVENDSVELVPWSPIPKMEQKYGAKKPYGFIGEFKAPGKQILVEVVNIKHYNIRDGVVFDWRINLEPTITQIRVDRKQGIGFNLNYAKLNSNYATSFDKQTGLPLDLKFSIDSVYGFGLNLKQHQTIPYSVYLISNIAGKVDTVRLNNWLIEDHYDFISEHYNKPGKYELIIQRFGRLGNWGKGQQLRIPFEVLPPPVLQKKASLKQILPYATATLTSVALLFLAYRRNSERKLARSAQEKEGINLKLRSIRSQLNPHFMFNALTSIQNLMNKNDTEAANRYLSMFADLTRKVLNTTEQELISIEDELKILEDYLQMEQLRFGFQYQINVDEGINIANTDIPAMLLQPFVENAIKHGVAALQHNGIIKVLIDKQKNDLILSVTDNGQGFNKKPDQSNKTSFGLKLSEERIALLNQMYKDQPVTLNIDSKSSGTVITIKLANLLS